MLLTFFNQGWEYCESAGNMIFDPRAKQMKRVPVQLPHDAAIHEKRSPDAPGGTAKGYYPSKDYDYFKRFTAPESWKEKRVWLLFEGAYMNARVFVNGDLAAQRSSGYTEFYVPLNDYLQYDKENEIKVSVQSGEDSRWYSGAGLYRNVSLLVGDALHIDLNGPRFTTLAADKDVASLQAEIPVVNDSIRPRRLSVEIEMSDEDGHIACRDTQILNMKGLSQERVCPRLYLRNPKLWSPDLPDLYRISVKLWEDGRVTDESITETFGIRVLTLDSVRGLAINGKPVKLYGGCIHHDNGVIGTATFRSAEERRARLQKEAGYNAIRSAHHPMSRAMLEACDRYGLLVMDELTDMWSTNKTRRDFSIAFEREWEDDLRAMVSKDYNHPCVIMYSMGNEIPESGSPAGAAIYRRLGGLTRQLDPTRYITAGLNNLLAGNALTELFQSAGASPEGGINEAMGSDLGDVMSAMSMHPAIVAATNESYESMDICGYNYAADRYVHDAEKFTNWISVGSETFPKDLAYNWKVVTENAHAIGDFSWTSWDYLGEAGIGADFYTKGEQGGFGQHPYPWRIAWDADFDITGRRTPQGYYREIVVGHRKTPYIAMQTPETYDREPAASSWSWPGTVSSWNWPGYEGKPIRIEVYGRGDEAELIVNGQSLGRKPLPVETIGKKLAFLAVFDAVYTPGSVEAVVYQGGVETGRYAVRTAGEPASLRVEADQETIVHTDGSLAFVDIWLEDEAGILNGGSDREITVTVEGCGTLQGLGSGNPCTAEDFFDDHCRTFFGHAFAVIRPTGTGDLTVTVQAEGLRAVVRHLRVIPG